jgi:hypothetical protein
MRGVYCARDEMRKWDVMYGARMHLLGRGKQTSRQQDGVRLPVSQFFIFFFNYFGQKFRVCGGGKEGNNMY